MSHLSLLILALLIDGLIGDPKKVWQRLPHPVVLLGRCVTALDKALNRGPMRRLNGVIAMAVLCGGVLVVGWGLAGLHWSVEVVVAALLLAQNSLVRHVINVAIELRRGLPEGRAAVAMIVGRDPENLDHSGVARGAIESAAENFSDGVVAPAFWFLIGGLPGILLYKMVNTADSMIGYRTEKYRQFGWAAARIDDVLNWIPARLTGLLIALTSLSARAFVVMRQDAGKHRSPNAGWPEAAMAAVLNVALAGPRIYDGKITDDPFVNAAGRKDIGAEEIAGAARTLWRGWGGLLGALLAIAIIIWLN